MRGHSGKSSLISLDCFAHYKGTGKLGAVLKSEGRGTEVCPWEAIHQGKRKVCSIRLPLTGPYCLAAAQLQFWV